MRPSGPGDRCDRALIARSHRFRALVVFDPGAVGGRPVGRELPVRVPFGFSGLWVDEAAL